MSQDIQQPENPAYYAARAAEERRLATASVDPNARAVHLEMAEKYAQLAEAGASAQLSPAADRERNSA